MTKHTPGPWHVNSVDGSQWAVIGPATTHQGCGAYICDMVNGSLEINAYIGHLEADANARLVAAAPELLAQLQTALRYIEHIGANCTERGQGHPQQALVDSIRNAIAKAEGRA
jgi:hypothetical protein